MMPSGASFCEEVDNIIEQVITIELTETTGDLLVREGRLRHSLLPEFLFRETLKGIVWLEHPTSARA